MKTTTKTPRSNNRVRIGIVVPHIFMQRTILPHVIFSPGTLALDLAAGLRKLDADVTLFSPGPIDTTVKNSTADLSLFEHELALRGDRHLDLLKKHPFTFVTLARQIQAELIAKAYQMANDGQLDVVHIYTNEEELALPFAALCQKPVVFTHHDPFNFLVKYKNNFPLYKKLNWLSISYAQRAGMPHDTHWVGNIYHGIQLDRFAPNYAPSGEYVAYLGRIVEPKGLHVAIAAAKQAGIKLKIAGKHYAGHKKDAYWQTKILPHIDDKHVEYIGHLRNDQARQEFLGNARALLMPSIFEEPFGMVMIEALACATPVIGLDSGAIPEVIKSDVTGYIVKKDKIVSKLAAAINKISTIDRHACRRDFERRFTALRMCQEHVAIYQKLIGQ